MKRYLAADFGAGSGRVIVGTPSTEGIQLEEIHRFENNQKMIDGHLRWDFNALFNDHPHSTHFHNGEKYFIAAKMFMLYDPIEIKEEVKKIVKPKKRPRGKR